ncbi:hypothetical protein [Nostoc parmelioides]|uniref:Glycoside hydrolase family 42 N-terminal domain-containing protein n=1 Tax=Nostoc parmelioides FACHB-3921 TaxID=2692909 RepID=A0ABR8BNU7_9NOSO|nr:hypothetical protein [Nostoc parmelioides]MBD2254501.1 hypothetical protein [Nostoc parmelioides FACHB-3921]
MKKLHLRSISSTLSSAFIYGMTLGLAFNAPLYAQTIRINEQSTPLDHLRAMPRPKFKSGARLLLPLSQSNCGVHRDIHIELANNWGYGLLVNKASLHELAKANPGRYKLIADIGSLYIYYLNYKGENLKLPILPQNTWLRDASKNVILDGNSPIVNPAAPEETFRVIGDHIGTQLSELERFTGQPIRMIFNGGESGIPVIGEKNVSEYYGRDPDVLANFNSSGLPGWYEYISSSKARHERLIKERIFSNLQSQSRPFYSLYQEQYGTERGRWWGWKRYIFLYEYFLNSYGKPAVSDYTAPEMYFSFHNSGWTGVHSGSLVPWDALTQALNNVSGSIRLGQKFSYPWVSMGWEGSKISNSKEFMGMMKAYYTAGAIGSVGGYFVCDGPIFRAIYHNTAIGSATPTIIKQYAVLGHVHALFSHLEEYLRDGDLLPGPNLHPYKDTTQTLPAMEFPVDGETQQIEARPGIFVTVPTARVVARKIRGQDRWLVTAWANVGEDRNIRVKIDNKLGTLTLRARKAGAVYVIRLVNGQIQRTLIDTDAMHPTKFLSSL